MTSETFKTLEKDIPKSSGVYRYYDKNNELIYVGKAKNLRNRVASYFQRDRHESAKTKVLVKKINRIEFTLVETEMDALLLENTLIKKHQPRYNIRLKDDKTYPSICIKNERFPRIFPTRRIVKDGSTYFGPYTSSRMMQAILDVIKKTFPLRTCNFNLSPQNIENKKFRLCLEYQIGNCLGPCENLQNELEYDENINQIKAILKGKVGQLIRKLNQEMQIEVSDLAFEKAQKIKEKIELLKKYESKSTVVNPLLDDLDVFSIVVHQDLAVVNYLKINNGAVVLSHNLEIKQKIDESPSDLLRFGLVEMRNKFESQSKEILVSMVLELESNENLKISVPKIGDKKKLIELSLKNAYFVINQKLKEKEKVAKEFKAETVLKIMQKDLNLKTLPRHIECFDNSNIQGHYPVSAMVLFRYGKPSKKEYRHYNIKTVEGPNDFASMEEVVFRRYRRLLEEKSPLPDLVIVDGGKGQLSAAVRSLEKLELEDKIPILGIAKNLEELYYPNDPIPLHIDKTSYSLKIIQQMRDEAHRFGITHHRNKRSKETFKSQLTEIQGIGPKTTEKLLKKYKSVANIKKLNFETLKKEIGEKKAILVMKNYE